MSRDDEMQRDIGRDQRQRQKTSARMGRTNRWEVGDGSGGGGGGDGTLTQGTRGIPLGLRVLAFAPPGTRNEKKT